ncbi:lasso peptide biosynthesis PqqD family chaperone [Streptomyces sp. NPDC053048]|uniref:lasso peptide biosynthesis PqqD family chaperone n=1 Tax=Streptomyces sp. NPDC053048 TaxID=3365694 RepID=UPI0037CFBD65
MSRLRPDVTACPTDDGMVLLNERTGRFWQLNATGALIVSALLEANSPEQVVEHLARSLPVSRERAAADVARLVDDLVRAGLVTRR